MKSLRGIVPALILPAVIMAVAVCAAQTESKSAPPPAAVPAPSAAGSPAAPEPTAGKYVIGPLDVLEIKVWHNPDLTGFFPVRPDGFISMPLIGEFKADGLTVAELTSLVKEKLSAQINDPDVNIQPSRTNSKKIFILGQCNRQGEMPLMGEMKVLDAISNCGGFKDFANPKKIYVLRGTQRFPFNYNDVSKGKRMEQNIVLQSGDYIIVPE
ncbi:MAG: polysaccharide biosynthesis/export family protein [Terriglobia bacterium]